MTLSTVLTIHKIYPQNYTTDLIHTCQCHLKTEKSFKYSQIMYYTPNYIMASDFGFIAHLAI